MVCVYGLEQQRLIQYIHDGLTMKFSLRVGSTEHVDDDDDDDDDKELRLRLLLLKEELYARYRISPRNNCIHIGRSSGSNSN